MFDEDDGTDELAEIAEEGRCECGCLLTEHDTPEDLDPDAEAQGGACTNCEDCTEYREQGGLTIRDEDDVEGDFDDDQ